MTQVNPRYFYVLIRKDLTLPQQICQAVHAAYESGLQLADPYQITDYTVVCEVPDESALLLAQEEIERKGFRTVVFSEPDLEGQATALATEPILSHKRKKMGKYKLWKGE